MRKIGIWIDQREANIITMKGNEATSKIIYSDIETRIRIQGEKKQFGRFGDQFMVDEKGKKNRIQEFTKKFLQKVVKEVASADNIIIFGPAQTKFKLEKLMVERPELATKLEVVKTEENMTHNQKLAYVRDFYTKK